MKIPSLILLSFLLLIQSQASLEQVESIVAKARAHLGTESALDAVQSIRYHGKITLFQEDDTQKEGEVVLTFMKPCSQRIEFIFPDQTMVTGFNGHEGWELTEGKLEDGKPYHGVRPMSFDDTRRTKAASVENLCFFHPFSFDYENVKDRGTATVDGKTTRRIDFIHNGSYVFSRFFDPNTGDLLRSELDTGVVTVETGEMSVDGIRFSDKIVGLVDEKATYEMDFDKIEVNSVINPAIFDYPDN